MYNKARATINRALKPLCLWLFTKMASSSKREGEEFWNSQYFRTRSGKLSHLAVFILSNPGRRFFSNTYMKKEKTTHNILEWNVKKEL